MNDHNKSSSTSNVTNQNDEKPHSMVEASIEEKERISKIWYLPLIALLIGIAMVYQHFQNKGIDATLTFDTAESLVAGKTLLKNRNVDIGVVTAVRFNDDKTKIKVSVEVDKEMSSFLVEDSQFWVVRPRIGAQGVSGIDTLLSGSYIEVEAGESRQERLDFIGLENPPVTPTNADGMHLKLLSKGNKALEIGTPIFYKGFNVGTVESTDFDDVNEEGLYDIFINAPFHNNITANTTFWNASGVSFKADADGISLDFASIESLISGGIEFGLVDGAEPGLGIPQYHTFQIYDSKDSVAQERVYESIYYIVLVEDSVSGLRKGAPVDYRGVRIGTVWEPFMDLPEMLKVVGDSNETRIPVTIRIEPQRLSKHNELSNDMFGAVMESWIRDGLTATIETASLITGALKISLNPDGEPVERVETFNSLQVIPFKSGAFANLTEGLQEILDKIEALELERTLDNVNDLIDTGEITLQSADVTFDTATGVIAKADGTLSILNSTLIELRSVLKGLQPNSSLYKSVEASINELEKAIGDVTPLIQEVSNKPNSLIFGGTTSPDLQPKLRDEANEKKNTNEQ